VAWVAVDSQLEQVGRDGAQMANADDLELLNSGELDLSGCDLVGADLSNRQLAGRDFSKADLSNVKAFSADFSRCRFSAANLHGLAADGANFSGASLSGILIMNGSFVNANLQEAVFSSAHIQNCNFSGADLSGANFRSSQLIGSTEFAEVKFDDATSFEGATGPRILSRVPLFARYTYEGGAFRAREPSSAGQLRGVQATGVAGTITPQVTRAPPFEGFDEGAFDPEAFDTQASEAGAVPQAAAVEAIALRIATEPQIFESLARYAARSIKNELEALDAKIPNEPGALEGYKTVRAVLAGLQTGFESLADTVHASITLTNSTERVAFLRKAAQAAQSMCVGFVDWMNEHGNKAGRVIAELGLAGTIAGTLSYFVGVPPMISFPITVAALSGKSIWEAIVLFAPGTKGKEK
jgi:uncharacterized protein YjbI with pentapeptide repeats